MSGLSTQAIIQFFVGVKALKVNKKFLIRFFNHLIAGLQARSNFILSDSTSLLN